MNDAVFISDLHLHPNLPLITQRFFAVTAWVAQNVRSLYILGDFFHVWAGDDTFDSFSQSIADRLAWLSEQGVCVYFMPGNRDFLLGRVFDARAKVMRLSDPSVIILNTQRVLLTHGDAYCTRDVGHQWLRRLTRNAIFIPLFLKFPRQQRVRWVGQCREYSQQNRVKRLEDMDIVPSVMLKAMGKYATRIVIHGHTHRPGESVYVHQGEAYTQYVLSDWDDDPAILVYNQESQFTFKRISEA